MQVDRTRRTEYGTHAHHEGRSSSDARGPVKLGHKQYPRKYVDYENGYPTKERLRYSPGSDWPCEEQDSKGKVRRTSPSGRQYFADPGFTRTIVNDKDQFRGISFFSREDGTQYAVRGHRKDPIRAPV